MDIGRMIDRKHELEYEAKVKDAHIATLEAELARVKELAVWAVIHECYVVDDSNALSYWSGGLTNHAPCDGTPSGILAALERAHNE